MTRLPFPLWWHIHIEHRLQYYRSNETATWPRLVRWIGRALYLTRRWCQGARRVECSGFDGTTGKVVGIVGDVRGSVVFGGACPVQGEGRICARLAREGGRVYEDWREVYYRSRGEGWEFCVAGPSGDPLAADAWVYSERGYFWPDGGWVSAAVSEACIRKAVGKWREGTR